MENRTLEIGLNQFRKRLLEGMIFAARNIELQGYGSVSGCKYIDVPLSFEPSSGDKLVFRDIIDEVLPTILLEDVSIEWNPEFIGWQIFVKRYYPFYGQHIEGEYEKEFGKRYDPRLPSRKKRL